MKCNQSIHTIINESVSEGFTQHLKQCKVCSEIDTKVNQQMALLDQMVELPSDLVSKTLRQKSQLSFPKPPVIDYSKYLQLAAVVVAGIFLGVFLGRNANSDLLASKKNRKDRALMEYRQNHQLDNETSIYKL